MSALTNLALLAVAVGGTYYFVEYRPAQERKKRRKAKSTPAPNSRVILIDSMTKALSALVEFGEKPVFIFYRMADKSVYRTVAPIVDKLSLRYPDLPFLEFDLASMLAEHEHQKMVKSNVSMVYVDQAADRTRCIGFFEGPRSFHEELDRYDEDLEDPAAECTFRDIRDYDATVADLETLASYAATLVPAQAEQAQFASRRTKILPGRFMARKGGSVIR